MKFVALFILSVAVCQAQPTDLGVAFPKKKLAPFLETYCIRCHGPGIGKPAGRRFLSYFSDNASFA